MAKLEKTAATMMQAISTAIAVRFLRSMARYAPNCSGG
jgi:hypothetical protein